MSSSMTYNNTNTMMLQHQNLSTLASPELEDLHNDSAALSRNLKLYEFSTRFQGPHGVITLLIAVFGIIFNLINMRVLLNPKLKSPVNLLLATLAFSETCLLLIYIPFILIFNILADRDLPRFSSISKPSAVYLLFYADASVIIHHSSVWLLIATACFRFVMVKYPTEAIKWCSYSRAIVTAICTVSASILYSIPNLIRNSLIEGSYGVNQSVPLYYIGESSMFHNNHVYWLKVNSFVYATIGKIVPAVLLLGFSIFLIHILKQAGSRRRRLQQSSTFHSNQSSTHTNLSHVHSPPSAKERHIGHEYIQTSRMLLAVVVIFFLVEFPHGVLVLWAGLTHNMETYELLGELIDLLTLVSFSINFLLYCVMSRLYRRTFVQALRHPCKKLGDIPKVENRRPSNGNTKSDHLLLSQFNIEERSRSYSVNSNRSILICKASDKLSNGSTQKKCLVV